MVAAYRCSLEKDRIHCQNTWFLSSAQMYVDIPLLHDNTHHMHMLKHMRAGYLYLCVLSLRVIQPEVGIRYAQAK